MSDNNVDIRYLESLISIAELGSLQVLHALRT